MATHIFRSLPLQADSRTLRNSEIFKTCSSKIYTWENNDNQQKAKSFPLKKSGNKLTKTAKFIAFSFWVPLQVLLHAKKGDLVVFMDLETAALGVFAAKIKKATSLFDIVDPFAQTKIKKIWLQKLANKLETKLADLADHVVVPHESRIKYYEDHSTKLNNKENALIIENVPSLTSKSTSTTQKAQKKITIGYFGTLDKENRGIEWLTEFCIRLPEKYNLLIGGGGALNDFMREKAAANENINFIGSYNPVDLSRLYSKIDFTWAYYSPKLSLHKYAAPNKFYEHLFFLKPIITSECIPHSDIITALNSGIIINAESNLTENFEDLSRSIEHYMLSASNSEISMSEYWSKNYENYYENLIKSEVIRKIKCK